LRRHRHGHILQPFSPALRRNDDVVAPLPRLGRCVGLSGRGADDANDGRSGAKQLQDLAGSGHGFPAHLIVDLST